MDCRQYTYLIVKKDGEYLQGCVMGTNVLKWTSSPYEAWRTRNREHEARVSNGIGGQIMLFNPVVGQIREYRGGT